TLKLDGKELATVENFKQRAGNVGFGTSTWINAQFDDIEIIATAPEPKRVPKSEILVTASSEHGFSSGWEYWAKNAIDDRPETMWHIKFNPRPPAPHFITLDLGQNHTVKELWVQ